MNLLFVTEKIDAGGGAEYQMQTEINILSKKHSITILTKEATNENNIFIRLEDVSFLKLSDLSDLQKSFYETFEIVHIHNCWNLDLLSILNLISCPIITTLHDYRIICPSGWAVIQNTIRECDDFSYQKCHKTTCLTCDRAKRLGWDYNTWFYLRNFIISKTTLFVTANPDLILRLNRKGYYNIFHLNLPIEYELKYNNQPRNFSISYGAAVLDEHKGVDRFIKTCKWINANYPSISINLFGHGPKLEDILMELSSKNNFTYYGFLSKNDIESLFSKTGIVYCPSRWLENYNLICRRSRLLGTPVLVPNTGGYPYRINKGFSQFYNPSNKNHDGEQLFSMLNNFIVTGKGSSLDRQDELSIGSKNKFNKGIEKIYQILCYQ